MSFHDPSVSGFSPIIVTQIAAPTSKGGAPCTATKPTSKNSHKTVVTRFAPSPTGYLHIGGARTALFCWLYAKHHGGQFRLRIEDTDAERHNEDAVTAILQGLNWLGTVPDGEIVRQSLQKARHQEIANKLLAEGKAYKCYCSKEELEAMRAEAEKNKVPFRYPGTYREVPPDFVPPEGIEPVVRIKTSLEGVTGWEDEVQGHIEFSNKEVDDFVILRADGSPTYLLAVVVDDHDMGITHVVRGADHISNTPRQLEIYSACGFEPPTFAHIPLIHGADGSKLSKRHGAIGTEHYEAMGYLPEAMRNYLARLSWSHGNDEIFSTEQAIEWFDLVNCNKSAACFDFDKLKNLNGHYIKECDSQRLYSLAAKICPELCPFEKKLLAATEMLKPRSKTVVEYCEQAEFIVGKRPVTVEEKVAKSLNSDAGKQVMKDIVAYLQTYSGEWAPEPLEAALTKFAQEKGMKLGQLAQPLRGALTGSSASPGIFEVVWIVGKEEVIARLNDSVEGKNPIKAAQKEEEAPAKEEKKGKAKGKEKKSGGEQKKPSGDQPEFTKLDIRVGLLTKTWLHPDSEKLFCEEIDIGDSVPRQVASGLRAFYSEAEFCAGRKVLVVANLKPAKMAGFESAGMVLGASNADHSKVELLEAPDGAKVGERVFIEGLEGEPLAPNQVAKKSILKNILPELKTNAECVACWQGKLILTSAGPIKVPTMGDSHIG